MAESYSVKAILSASDRGFSSAFKSAQSSAERLKSTLTSGLGFGIMTGIGQKAFSAITSGISGVTGELNESSAAWKTFNGNMQMIGKGTKSITKTRDELQDFATKTIYSASDMATTYSQLAAVGTKNCTKLVKGFGGLAAASENPTQAMKTLSQQATQAAAKPTIQWMDFKLMLEQTPAGIAAVAKGMGKTTSQLVQDVQDGKVKTEDFFNAIAKVGTNKSFTKLATSYKTAGQAMDGLKETLGVKLMPTFNKTSDVAISGIEKVIGRLDKVDPDGLAKKVESAVSVVSPYWKAFSDATSKARKAIINAVSAVGKSFGGLAQKKSSLDTFTSVVSGISDAIAHFAQIVADHSDEIASAAPKILKLLLAIKGFKIIQSLVPGVTTFASALLKIGGKGIAALAGKLFGVAAGEKAVGTASKESFGSLVQSATAFLKMGAGIALVAAGFALLTLSAINLAKAGPLAAGVMLGMVVAIGGLLVVAKEVAPTLTAGAAGFIAFGAAVVLAGAGMLLLTTAATNLASAGPVAIGVMVGMVAAVALLAAGAYESLGEKLSDKFKSQMEKKRDSALKSVKNMINAYVKPLKKHNKKASSKYTKAGRYLNSAFSKSYKAEVKKLIKAADSTFDKLGKKYQKKYDAIIDARKSFMENLGNISSLYTADDYGNIALKDFNVGTKQINAYAKNLEKLKKILPDGLMEEILGLSTAEGLAYTNNLLKMSTKNLKAYGASYTKFQNAAKKTATNYYAPKLSSLKKDFSAQVTKEAKALKKRMTTIGANAMSGFVSGMSSKKKSLSKESRILANEVIKAFRKKLKIHSPSRVFASLATYTAKGYINQLESMRHKIADVAQSIVTIPDVASPKLAGDYTGDLSTEYEYYSNAKYTIVVPVEVDGREVARTTAPYMQSELDSRQSRENRRRGRK